MSIEKEDSFKVEEVRLKYILYDQDKRSRHDGAVHEYATGVDQIDFSTDRKFTVAEVLRRIQGQHRSEHTSCTTCSKYPDTMLVVSAWLVTRTTNADPVLDLVHNPDAGTELLSPWSIMGEHIKSYDTMCLVVATTTDFGRAPKSPVKRPLEISGASEMGRNDKIAKQESSEENGIYVAPYVHPWPNRLDLPPRKFNFISLTTSSSAGRMVFVDKTGFISEFDALLETAKGIVSGPPGFGKTTMLSILLAWFDCKSSATVQQLFDKLHIGRKVQSHPPSAVPPFSRQQFMCLHLDFGPESGAFRGSRTQEEAEAAFSAYLFKVLREFARKYKTELGVRSEDDLYKSGNSTLYAVELLDILFEQAQHARRKIFIGIDNFDHLLLLALAKANANVGAELDVSQRILSPVLSTLCRDKNSRLLITSTLPAKLLPSPSSLTDISSLPQFRGAFGLSAEEVDDLCSVFSKGTTTFLNRTGPEMDEKLGLFSPTFFTPHARETASQQRVYNFELVLHQVAKTFALTPSHQNPPQAPLLREFSKNHHDLLRYLRRIDHVLIPPFQKAVLSTISRDENILWLVLYFLGALRVMQVSQEKQGSRWDLAVSGPFAASQLFWDYPKALLKPPTTAEQNLRALLNGNHGPMIRTMTDLLEMMAPIDIYDLPEASFQCLFDAFYWGEFKGNYFPQLRLLTDHKKSVGEKKQPAGFNRNGFADIFCLGTGGMYLRPRYGVVIELKSIRPSGLVRHFYGSKAEWKKDWWKSSRDPSHPNRKRLEDVLRLPLDQLRSLKYVYFDADSSGEVTTTVGQIMDDAVKQLQSYLNAILAGAAVDSTRTPGAAEKIGISDNRIDIPAEQKGRVQRVSGRVVVAIGPRIEVIPVQGGTSMWDYRGKTGWSHHYPKAQK